MNEDRFRKLFLLVVVAGISTLFLVMIRGFVMTLLLASVLAGLMFPLYRRIDRALGGRHIVSSLVTLLVLILGVFGPLATLAGVVAQQAIGLMETVGPALKPFMDDPDRIRRELTLIPGLSRIEPFLPQIAERSAQIVSGVGSFLLNRVSAATSGTVMFLFDFAILLYAMFFFFLHGRSWLRTILAYLPFSDEDGERLLERFVSVTRATVKGTLLIGAIQGTINGIAFWVVGLPAPAFWGAVMIILSVIPAIGGALVWVPAAIWLAVTGRMWQAIVLLVLCGAVSGSVDNVLRPRLVGRDTKMPDLLILVSTLGGLGFFGAIGFIVGPLVTALFLTLWQILGELYRPSPVVKSGGNP